MRNILVIAPHPDDETLGCGGTLLRHSKYGDKLHWLIMTTLDESKVSPSRINARAEEIKKVKEIYNFESLKQLEHKTTELDAIKRNDIINDVSNFIRLVNPEIMYIPNRYDVHSDHKIVFDAAVASTKSFRNPILTNVRVYETLSETEFNLNLTNNYVPNLFINISEFLNKKIDIFKIYSGEFGEHPFPRSENNIRALATLRGATAGCNYAESFMSIREIVK